MMRSVSGNDPIVVFYLAPELLTILSRLVQKVGLVLDDAESGDMLPSGEHEPVCITDPNGSEGKAMLELAKAILSERLAIEAIGERRFAMSKRELKRFIKTWDSSQQDCNAMCLT